MIKLSQNEWVKFLFVQNGWIQDGRIQDGCHHQVESEWMSLKSNWTSLCQSVVQNGWIQEGRIKDGRIQDGCHHQVESEWMSEVLFVHDGWIQDSENSRWLPSSSWVWMNEWSFFFIQNDWIYDMAEFKIGCLHQVESEWMSEIFLSQMLVIRSWQV